MNEEEVIDIIGKLQYSKTVVEIESLHKFWNNAKKLSRTEFLNC